MIILVCYMAVSFLTLWAFRRFADIRPDDAFRVWYFSAFWPLGIAMLAIGGAAQLLHLAHGLLTRKGR